MKSIIFTIAAFLLFGSAAFGQGSIGGTITDAKGNGIAKVTVTVVGPDGKAVVTVTTDDDGEYTIDGLAAGKYKIVAGGAKGLGPATRDNVMVNDDETATIDITLAAAAAAPPKPAVPARAPVDEIIAKNIEALGGRDLIGKIRSIYMETTSQVMGNETSGSITVLDGKGYRSETEFNGSKMIQVYNDKGGWSTNPMAGSSASEAMPEEQYGSGKAQIQIGGELFDYAAKGNKAELLGKDGNLYKIKLTTRDNRVSIFYVDPATYFVTKVTKTGEAMGQQVEITISYSDYKKTDQGFTIPYTTQLDFGSMFSTTTIVRKVEINKQVDPKIFEMPK